MNLSLDLREFAEKLALSSDRETADFAKQILELVDNEHCIEEYYTIVKDLDNLTDKKFVGDAGKALNDIEDKLGELDEAKAKIVELQAEISVWVHDVEQLENEIEVWRGFARTGKLEFDL